MNFGFSKFESMVSPELSECICVTTPTSNGKRTIFFHSTLLKFRYCSCIAKLAGDTAGIFLIDSKFKFFPQSSLTISIKGGIFNL